MTDRTTLRLSDERKILLNRVSEIIAANRDDNPPTSDVIDAALTHLIESENNLADVRDQYPPQTVKDCGIEPQSNRASADQYHLLLHLCEAIMPSGGAREYSLVSDDPVMSIIKMLVHAPARDWGGSETIQLFSDVRTRTF
jgi:hypothetical protein